MENKTKLTLLVISLTVVLAACSKNAYTAYEPNLDDAHKAGISVETLQTAKQIYTTNCNKCHGYKAPEKFTKAEWDKILPRMSKKAKINAADATLLAQYVTARAKITQ